MYKLPKGMQKIMDELNKRPHDGMHYKQILEAVGTTNAHYALKKLEDMELVIRWDKKNEKGRWVIYWFTRQIDENEYDYPGNNAES